MTARTIPLYRLCVGRALNVLNQEQDQQDDKNQTEQTAQTIPHDWLLSPLLTVVSIHVRKR